MGKKKGKNYRCNCCGFECDKEDELLRHCAKEHPDNYMLPYMMVGKFATLEQATIAFGKLNIDFRNLTTRAENLTKENKQKDEELLRLSKAINIYNEAAHGITHTMSLLSTSLEPYQNPKP